MSTPRIAVLFAEGFEEIEAVTLLDVLRRAQFGVIATGVAETAGPVTGAHGLPIIPDCAIADLDPDELAMVVLPGGMPGSTNLAGDSRVLDLLRAVRGRGGWLAAICAAPIALQAAGVLTGKRVTCYPSFETRLEGACYTGRTIECDDRIATSRGPGTALPFALELVAILGRPEVAAELRRGMLVDAVGEP